MGNEAIVLTENITHTQANTIDAYTTGVVTATISVQTVSDLDDLSGTKNNYTIICGISCCQISY